MDQTSDSLLASSLFFRVGAMAKYAVSTIGLIAGGIGSVFTGISSAVDLVKGARQRQKNYDNLPKYMAGLLVENIYQKKFIFFGKSKLDKYVEDNYKLSGKKAKEYLNNLDDEQFKKLSVNCVEYYLKQDIEKFLASKKLEANEDNLNKYLKNKVSKSIFRSTLWSSSIATLKLSAATLSPGFLFPPLSGIFMAGAGAVLISGAVGGAINAKLQERKFLNKTEKLLNNDPEITDIEREDIKKIKDKLFQIIAVKNLDLDSNKKSFDITHDLIEKAKEIGKTIKENKTAQSNNIVQNKRQNNQYLNSKW